MAPGILPHRCGLVGGSLENRPSPPGGDSRVNPGDVVRRLVSLLGSDPGPDEGVVHVTAVWRNGSLNPVVLKIGSATPRSSSDTFLLAAMRARADAVLTTGAILRAEPRTTLELPGPPATVRALAAWRREVLGRPRPPVGMVLTSGRELDFGHPFFDGPGRRVVFTDAQEATRLRRIAPRTVRIVGDPAPGTRTAVAHLRQVEGARTVLIETGPSAGRDLYRSPLAIDELVLSIWEGENLPRAVVGGELPSLECLDELFTSRSSPVTVDETSGRWTFQRFIGCASAASRRDLRGPPSN